MEKVESDIRSDDPSGLFDDDACTGAGSGIGTVTVERSVGAGATGRSVGGGSGAETAGRSIGDGSRTDTTGRSFGVDGGAGSRQRRYYRGQPFYDGRGEIEAKASPREDAETVIRYQSGDKIYVTGELADGWCRVRYQDLTGYIRPAQAAEIERDVEALDDEFAAAESEGKLVVEEVERQRTETKRSRIWGAVILLLVAGIFVTGIFSVVRSRRTEDTEQ